MSEDTSQQPNVGGAPTKYKTSYNIQVFKLCLLGSTKEQIANFFDVHVDTITEWMNVYPKFSAAIKDGREKADATVANSLYKKALGYNKKITQKRYVHGKLITESKTEHIPADTTAAIFWLKNRSKAVWRDKHEVDHTTDGKPLNVSVVSYADAVKQLAEGKQPQQLESA